MKYLSIIISLFFPLLLSAQEDGPWTYFQSLNGDFSIDFPDGPRLERNDTVETAIGELVYHIFLVQKDQKADNVMYMLSYCDYPEGTIHSDSTELLNDFFEATMDQAAKSVNGELTYFDFTWYNDYPGYFWRIDYLDGKVLIKTKAFLVDRRYYALQTVTIRPKSLNLSIDRFMDSFRVIK
jgi:hypothetical protein